MNFTEEALRILARQLGADEGASREELEERVTPLLCGVLRTGAGRPSLVRFVRRHVRLVTPHLDDKVDPQWAAPQLARLLIAHLLRQIRAEGVPGGARDTVMA
jgi:hypothetical protein